MHTLEPFLLFLFFSLVSSLSSSSSTPLEPSFSSLRHASLEPYSNSPLLLPYLRSFIGNQSHYIIDYPFVDLTRISLPIGVNSSSYELKLKFSRIVRTRIFVPNNSNHTANGNPPNHTKHLPLIIIPYIESHSNSEYDSDSSSSFSSPFSSLASILSSRGYLVSLIPLSSSTSAYDYSRDIYFVLRELWIESNLNVSPLAGMIGSNTRMILLAEGKACDASLILLMRTMDSGMNGIQPFKKRKGIFDDYHPSNSSGIGLDEIRLHNFICLSPHLSVEGVMGVLQSTSTFTGSQSNFTSSSSFSFPLLNFLFLTGGSDCSFPSSSSGLVYYGALSNSASVCKTIVQLEGVRECRWQEGIDRTCEQKETKCDAVQSLEGNGNGNGKIKKIAGGGSGRYASYGPMVTSAQTRVQLLSLILPWIRAVIQQNATDFIPFSEYLSSSLNQPDFVLLSELYANDLASGNANIRTLNGFPNLVFPLQPPFHYFQNCMLNGGELLTGQRPQ